MADGGENRDGVSASVRVINHCSAHHRRAEDLDSISSLPDVILHEILSFIPTKSAITTSVLSKRWRHVWSYTPSLYFDSYNLKADSINKTLAQHRARKVMTFHLHTDMLDHLRWIEFVISRNVENLLVDFFHRNNLPDLFYINSSVKQLSIGLNIYDLIPRCSVSWESLKKLSLRCCKISDESIDKILSGCPILESLTLYSCLELRVLDLSKSPRLRILDIHRSTWVPGPIHIVAPHIHCLRLINSQFSCTFVDVSSLTEAKLDLCFCSREDRLKADFLQDMVLKMLDKLQNVEKLTFGANFLKILSLAEVCGVPFPMFKAKALTLDTMISQYVIPGILRVLQNSPELKKLTVHTVDCDTIPDKYLGKYLNLHGLNVDRCRVFENISHMNVKSKHMASFMELMLKTTKTLEKMVVRLESYLDGRGFEELLEMVPVLSRNNNVSIVLSSAKRSQECLVLNLIGHFISKLSF